MPDASTSRQPSARPRTRRGQDTRDAILRAAEVVIGETGFAAASIADITRKAGIAQGTFYIYFQSKDEVFRELVLEMSRLTRAFLTEADPSARPAYTTL